MAVSVGTCFRLSGFWPFSSDASCTYGAAILGNFFYSLAVSTSTPFFYPYPSSIKADYIDYLQSWTYWHVAGYLYRVLGALFFSAGRWLNGWFGVLSCALICHNGSMIEILISFLYLWTARFLYNAYSETLTWMTWNSLALVISWKNPTSRESSIHIFSKYLQHKPGTLSSIQSSSSLLWHLISIPSPAT